MQTLNLSTWTLEKGAPAPSAEGFACTPDADGEVALSLSGTPGSLGGLTWSPEDYLIIDFCADMDRMAVLLVEFEEQDGDPPQTLIVRNFYIPGRRVKLAVQLTELDSHRFFLPTLPGGLKGHVHGMPTHIGRIGKVRIRLASNDSCRLLTLYGVHLAPALPDMRVQGAPMVDPMGQRIGYDWPDKMHSIEEMTTYLRKELAQAQSAKGYPDGWSRWGGWKAKRFDATGFFHTHHDGRRWWLVDPDGYAFFSNGVCYGSRMGVHGFVDRMESLFEWLPDRDDPTYRECWTTADQIPEFVKRNGAAAGKGRAMFNFPRANMIRAFGPERWWDAWVTIN
ncbi:MAG TPA: beta-galactosidase, partial [Clostridia bacterium]|nr:beta-galactosidase [Clostridia bacterium]